MAAEIAAISIIKSDSALSSVIGNRVFPLNRPQKSTFPAIVVMRQSVIPSDSKDGASTLDIEFVQVLMYSNDYRTLVATIEPKVRALLDRTPRGTYNTITLQSSRFEDNDTWYEENENGGLYVIEHIYKMRVMRFGVTSDSSQISADSIELTVDSQ